MCADDDGHASVKVSDADLARVRELRAVAVDAMAEANRILAKYMDIDPDTIETATIGLKRKSGAAFDGVPPVYSDPCTQFNSGGACAYLECDPPGVTKPCPPVTLPA